MEKHVESWEDISIILYDGNKEEIRGLRCPVWGHGDTGYIPNCVKYFGEVYTIE